MKCFVQILILIVAVQWCCEVKCKPYLKKHAFKHFKLGFVSLPPKHVSFIFEKTTPFGTYGFEHTIKKRQITEVPVLPPLSNEVHGAQDISNDPLRVPLTHSTENLKDGTDVEKLPAEVIITSVVEPLEPGKPISFLLPVDSEVVITPAIKEESVPIANEVPAIMELEPKPEVVASPPSVIEDIIPKPIEIPPPPEALPVEPNVVLTTSVESTVPPINRVPIFQNVNTPVISPIINSIPVTPFLYTDINRVPLYTPTNVVPFITPVAVPFPEIIPQPAPPIKESPPVEPPNFFTKSSRFILAFGSMMLQMLSQFVNGRPNFNQIPLSPPFPGVQ